MFSQGLNWYSKKKRNEVNPMETRKTDLDLILEVQAGSSVAFEELCTRYTPLFRSKTREYFQILKDYYEYEDLYQEILVCFYKSVHDVKFEKITDPSRFKIAVLFVPRIEHNVKKHLIRKHYFAKRKVGNYSFFGDMSAKTGASGAAQVENYADIARDSYHCTPKDGIEAEFEHNEFREKLRTELTPAQDMILSCLEAQMDLGDISKEMDISRYFVKKEIGKIKSKMAHLAELAAK